MNIPFYEYKTKLVESSSNWQLDFPPHLHDCPELVRVQGGTLKVQLNTQEYLVSSGQIIIIFPNIIHSYQTVAGDADSKFDLIICGLDSNNGFPRRLIGSSPTSPVQNLSELHPDVDYVFSALASEVSQGKNEQIIHAYLQILWQRLLPQLAITNSAQHAASDLTANLLIYIRDHFCEPLSLDLLSKELGVCRFYLSHIFSQVLHIGFCDYVNALRINHAKKLLQGTQDNILDIAIQCGFQSQQTFNRVFKELCGVTPSAYRNRD